MRMKIIYGQYVFLLPIITNGWVLVGFTTTFAMTYNSSAPELPYISYTGTEGPQRGIFTMVTTVTAILAVIIEILRYKFLTHFRVIRNNRHLNRANKFSLPIGLTAMFGLIMVGCFQVDSVPVPHYLGAFACFIMAIVYMFMQTILTFRLKDGKSGDNSIQAANFAAGHSIYQREKKKNIGTKFDILLGYFLWATLSEWLLCFSVVVFLLTFIPNFRRISGLKVDVKPLNENYRYSNDENSALGNTGIELINEETD